MESEGFHVKGITFDKFHFTANNIIKSTVVINDINLPDAEEAAHAAVEEIGLRPRTMVGELGAEPLPERRTESILEVEVSPLDMDPGCVDSGGEVSSVHAQPSDDLRDGGAQHFADCIREAKLLSPDLQVEVLVPDFRGRMAPALEILTATPPDVFNHNMETVPRLYREARPGANYEWSLKLLKDYKAINPHVPTKSGLMVGLGETKEELLRTLDDLRAHDVDMLTVGQYLQPSVNHLPVDRFVHPDEFAEYTAYAESIGFKQAACGPLVRSSYHADKQARGEDIT